MLAFLAMAPFVIPGHRARDRLLRRLHPAAAAAVRHRVDPDPGVRHALPADRLREQQRGDPQHQPGAGGRGAHPGRQRDSRRIRRVVVPLLRRSLAGAFILVFIPATRELSTAIFLYSTNTQVLSVLLFDKSDEGNFEMLASIGPDAAW